MDGHAGAAAQGGVLDVVPDVQLIEGMAALVDDGVHAGGESLLMVVGGDAHVVLGEVGGEGMLRFPDGTVVPIDGHDLHEPVGEPALLLDGKALIEESVVHHGALGRHGLDQGQKLLAQQAEEPVQGGHGQALFILIQQHVVGGPVRVPVAGKLPGIGQQLLQMGGEEGVIVGELGLAPGVPGVVLGHLIGHILLHGDLLGPLHLLPELLGLPAGDVVHLFPVGKDIADHLLQLRAGGELIHFLGEDGIGHAQMFAAAPGHDGFGIVAQHAEGMAVGVHLGQMFLELADGLFHNSPRGIFHQYTKRLFLWQFANGISLPK